MIRQAYYAWLKGICFTEHLDPDYPPTPDDLEFSLELPAYYARLMELKEAYKDQIAIHFGIEIGLQLHLRQYFHNLLKEYPFDFVIGSSHVVHGADPYYPEFFQAGTRNRPTLNISNPFWRIWMHFMKWTLMDIWIILSATVQTKTSFILIKKYRNILDAILKKTGRHKCRTGSQHRRLSLRSWRAKPMYGYHPAL